MLQLCLKNNHVIVLKDLLVIVNCFLFLFRKLFWTDWGSSPKIETAYLDGSNRSILVNSSVSTPNGLTIDYEKEIIFWCDATFDRIESLNLRSQERIILVKAPEVAHPFGITFYSDAIFWTDWGKRTIKRLDIETKELQTIRDDLSSLMGIEVFDKKRQQGFLLFQYLLL